VSDFPRTAGVTGSGCGCCSRSTDLLVSRRELLTRLGGGIASLAFADLLGRNGLMAAQAPQNPLAPRPQHFPAKAKAVISIFCCGGVSQVDTFDPKPDLLKYQGETMKGVGEVRATMGTPGGLMPSPWQFKKHGQSGMEVSELFPHVAQHVDDLALVRSMHCLSPAHGPALFQMNTGSILAGHPSVGSWVTYGLGSENENLPGFIVFTDHRGGPINGPPNWGNGYMPAAYQGTQFRDTGSPIVDLKPPRERTADEQRRWLRLLHELNEKHAAQNPQDTELAARIHTYELAFRMQTSAPDAIDISRESAATLKLYGVGEQPTDYFGRQALMARRLVERGVRFVQIFSGGGNFEPSWDAHWDLKTNHGLHCAETDKPIAGLIKDLKSRGLFDSTLIIWHGEFGRLPISERMDGRDHNNNGFSVWLAGGGVKGGTIVGATDQYGYRAVENPKTVHELHATILHLLGLDYDQLTYRFNGRDMKLTDVHGELITEILAQSL
jgi:Protein of unknown function (DUF1501)